MTSDKSHFDSGRRASLPNGGEFADDMVMMYTHGTTHVDALGHFWRGDRIYNDKPASSTIGGLRVNSIVPIGARGIVGRGVLLDVARFKGVSHLSQGQVVTLADLLATAAAQGVTIEPHDLLLVRTGWLGHFEEGESNRADEDGFSEPGLQYDEDLVDWFFEREIPLLATDGFTNECWIDLNHEKTMELHISLMSELGILFSELNVLDELAADCASDGQFDFLYAASPLMIYEATAGPLNPVAIK
jgi:kynurenine formamidase